MEHDLAQMLPLNPQDHLMVNSGFLDIVAGAEYFPGAGSGFVSPVGAPASPDDDCGWMEDLIQLGSELFDGGAGDDANAGTGDHQPWQCNGGGSPDDAPPASMSLDCDGNPPSVEQGATGEVASERKKRDRSKTIVSERKRRVLMKEKLYELRSLVPNITKMDKASIIADAVEYVKNLQAHARKLKEELASLEAARKSAEQEQQQKGRRHRRRRDKGAGAPPQADGDAAGSTATGARVTHVGATQVGQGRFFVTVECEWLDGAAAPFCAAVESLACFRVESSSLGRSPPDRVVLTLTLKVDDQIGDAATIGEGKVKLWVMAALLNEGFRPKDTVQIP